ASANLTSGQTASFSATALDQFGDPLSAQPSFNWTLDPGSVGGIDINSGLYAAPLSPVGSAMVRATSGAASGTAAVNVGYLKGDVDINGQRDIADVMAMMFALADLPTYQSSHSLSNSEMTAIFDTDGDMQATNTDIQGLLNLLADGGGGGSGSTALASADNEAEPATGSVSGPTATIAGPVSGGPHTPAVDAKLPVVGIAISTHSARTTTALLKMPLLSIVASADYGAEVISQPTAPPSRVALNRYEALRTDLLAVDRYFHCLPAARRSTAIHVSEDDLLADQESIATINRIH